MRKIAKNFVAVMLGLSCVLTALPEMELQAVEGKCGDNVNFVLSSDGKTLTLSGTGDYGKV